MSLERLLVHGREAVNVEVERYVLDDASRFFLEKQILAYFFSILNQSSSGQSVKVQVCSLLEYSRCLY
jgi:hypothetical protein